MDGIVTRIFVKAGRSASAPARRSSRSIRTGSRRRCAAPKPTAPAPRPTSQYWRQQVKRLQALVTAGAISRQEFEQAQNSLKTAEAKLAAIDAQVSEDRVQLRYYRVVAPQDGIVGDIAIRAGDRVTDVDRDHDDRRELVARGLHPGAARARAGAACSGCRCSSSTPTARSLATNPISFVAPRVDDATQIGAREEPAQGRAAELRSQQFVRARIVWSTAPGLTVPVVAVSRDQRPVLLLRRRAAGQRASSRGSVRCRSARSLGDDYVVDGGLKAGDRVDRLRHPEARRRRAGQSRSRMFVDTFIRRPILASVCSLVLILAGAIAIPTMPVAQYPPLAPPQVTVSTVLHRRRRPGGRDRRHDPARAGDQRRRGHALHDLVEHQQRRRAASP